MVFSLRNLNDFIKFIKLPTPDPMKQALWNLLQTGANPISAYHKKIIESEFLIKKEVPIELIDKIIYIGNDKSFYNHYQIFSRIFKEPDKELNVENISHGFILAIFPDLKIKAIEIPANDYLRTMTERIIKRLLYDVLYLININQDSAAIQLMDEVSFPGVILL